MNDHSVNASRSPGGAAAGRWRIAPATERPTSRTRNMRLDGKTAVVTGAASGIGRATAEALADAGAHVLLGDITEDRGAEAAAAIRGKGKGADFIRMDVTDLGSIEAFKQAAYAKRPQIDIVVNVAGLGKVEAFFKNTPEFWRKVIDLNFLGPVAVTRAFL